MLQGGVWIDDENVQTTTPTGVPIVVPASHAGGITTTNTGAPIHVAQPVTLGGVVNAVAPLLLGGVTQNQAPSQSQPLRQNLSSSPPLSGGVNVSVRQDAPVTLRNTSVNVPGLPDINIPPLGHIQPSVMQRYAPQNLMAQLPPAQNYTDSIVTTDSRGNTYTVGANPRMGGALPAPRGGTIAPQDASALQAAALYGQLGQMAQNAPAQADQMSRYGRALNATQDRLNAYGQPMPVPVYPGQGGGFANGLRAVAQGFGNGVRVRDAAIYANNVDMWKQQRQIDAENYRANLNAHGQFLRDRNGAMNDQSNQMNNFGQRVGDVYRHAAPSGDVVQRTIEARADALSQLDPRNPQDRPQINHIVRDTWQRFGVDLRAAIGQTARAAAEQQKRQGEAREATADANVAEQTQGSRISKAAADASNAQSTAQVNRATVEYQIQQRYEDMYGKNLDNRLRYATFGAEVNYKNAQSLKAQVEATVSQNFGMPQAQAMLNKTLGEVTAQERKAKDDLHKRLNENLTQFRADMKMLNDMRNPILGLGNDPRAQAVKQGIMDRWEYNPHTGEFDTYKKLQGKMADVDPTAAAQPANPLARFTQSERDTLFSDVAASRGWGRDISKLSDMQKNIIYSDARGISADKLRGEPRALPPMPLYDIPFGQPIPVEPQRQPQRTVEPRQRITTPMDRPTLLPQQMDREVLRPQQMDRTAVRTVPMDQRDR
jgi:hypothetical protein